MYVDDFGIEVIVVSFEFHAKFMLHSNISNFQQSKYSNRLDGTGRDDPGKSAYLISGTTGRSRKF